MSISGAKSNGPNSMSAVYDLFSSPDLNGSRKKARASSSDTKCCSQQSIGDVSTATFMWLPPSPATWFHWLVPRTGLEPANFPDGASLLEGIGLSEVPGVLLLVLLLQLCVVCTLLVEELVKRQIER